VGGTLGAHGQARDRYKCPSLYRLS
jgi:hypothetical protein